MDKIELKVTAEVNGIIYQSKVDRFIENEEAEQIASCKRHIRKMLDADGISDVCPDYKIERIK